MLGVLGVRKGGGWVPEPCQESSWRIAREQQEGVMTKLGMTEKWQKLDSRVIELGKEGAEGQPTFFLSFFPKKPSIFWSCHGTCAQNKNNTSCEDYAKEAWLETEESWSELQPGKSTTIRVHMSLLNGWLTACVTHSMHVGVRVRISLWTFVLSRDRCQVYLLKDNVDQSGLRAEGHELWLK